MVTSATYRQDSRVSEALPPERVLGDIHAHDRAVDDDELAHAARGEDIAQEVLHGYLVRRPAAATTLAAGYGVREDGRACGGESYPHQLVVVGHFEPTAASAALGAPSTTRAALCLHLVGALLSLRRVLGCCVLWYTARTRTAAAARPCAGEEVTKARGLSRSCAVGPSDRRGQSRATATTAAQECPRRAEREHGSALHSQVATSANKGTSQRCKGRDTKHISK